MSSAERDGDEDIEGAVAEDRKYPDIDRGWAWPVLCASWLSQVISGGSASSIGIFHLYLTAAFQRGETQTAMISSVFSGLSSCAGPLASLIMDATSVRVCILIGGILATVGMIAASQATSFTVVFITLGIISGTGLGLTFTPAVVVPGYYFVKRRSMACGIGVTGYSCGIILIPVILRALESSYGWRGAFLVLAGIMLNLCVCGMIMRPSIIERNRGVPQITLTVEPGDRDFKTLPKKTTRCSGCWSGYNFIVNKRYISLWSIFFFSNISMNIMFLYLPTYAKSLGATSFEMDMLYIVLGFGNVSSRVLVGLGTNSRLTDTALDKLTVLFGALGLQSIAMLAFPWYSSTGAGRLTFAGLVGFYYGVQPSVTTPIAIESVGLNRVSAAVGVIMLGKGLGMAIGPPVATAVYNYSGNHTAVFILGGLINSLAAFCCLLMTSCQSLVQTNSVTMVKEDTSQRDTPLVNDNTKDNCCVEDMDFNVIASQSEITKL